MHNINLMNNVKKYKNYKKYSIIIFSFFWLGVGVLQGQQLSKEEAVRLALENNFGIVLATNAIEIAENNKSILNSGYLPTVTGNASATYNNDNVEAQFSNGTISNLTGAESDRYNASVNLNYTLLSDADASLMKDFVREKLENNEDNK